MSSALWTQVKLIYDTQTLKELTNKRNPAGSSIDDTYGTRIATMAASWFQRKVQAEYDSTDDGHNEVAVWACYVMLRKVSGKFADIIEREVQSVEEAMVNLRKIKGHGRVMPTTDSVLEMSTEDTPGVVDRPNFDSERFDSITPDGPPAL